MSSNTSQRRAQAIVLRSKVEDYRTWRLTVDCDHAERVVARTLGISQGKLRAICGGIRALRRKDAQAAFPPISLAEHERWMDHGELPRRLDR